MMHRRRFLLTSVAGALAASLAAEGQQAGKVYRIGMLDAESSQTQEQLGQSAFVRTLRELGWVEGRNLAFEDRRSTNVEQLDSLAAELVTLKVAAKRATTSIPIVMLVGVERAELP